MVKFYTNSFSYDYPLPAVSLAYFLRYPNPYSTHVLSTDVISRHLDPVTQRLHTTRLHLKRSKLPPAILKLLPKGIVGGGEGQSFILETSVVDVRDGWMETESRNMEWTGVLSVVERQRYTRPAAAAAAAAAPAPGGILEASKHEATDVTTTVTFRSRFGQPRALSRRMGEAGEEEDGARRAGFLQAWSAAAVQRTIEATGLQRTRKGLVKSKDGMNVVLERMRAGGLKAAVDGMRRDRERAAREGG
jgi:hypothetical protein